jgi:uncharacterized protein (TIGR03435 family)
LFHPVLLLPAGIAERFEPRQVQAILAHELCHFRRRDNLTSAAHMVVEALFWFHPLVWWIGSRLIEERERACDEAVVSLGNEPHDYAQAILSVCKSYLELPLSCVSGVTGSDLKKRIQAILAGRVTRNLNVGKKLALVACGIAVLIIPITAGMASAPAHLARSAATPKFEVVSVKSCDGFRKNTPHGWSAERVLHSQCTTLEQLIRQAYGLFANRQWNVGSSLKVTGGPAWIRSDLYQVDAKTSVPQSRATLNGPMLQAVLEDRFRLKVHSESREVPVYAVTVAEGGPNLQPFRGSCVPRDFDKPPSDSDCGTVHGYADGFYMKAATITDLCAGFSVLLNKPVEDKTGITGRFNLRLDFSREGPGQLNRARSLPAVTDPTKPVSEPVDFQAAKIAMRNLGLDLEPAKAGHEFLVIDQVERPSGG